MANSNQNLSDSKNTGQQVDGIIIADAVIDSLPGIFYLFDEEGKLHRWNKDLEYVSGYASEEIAQMHALDFFSRTGKVLFKKKIAEVFNSGKSDIDANLVAKNGSKMPFHFTCKRVDFNGKTYFSGMGIDISEKKTTEKELLYSEERYRAFIEHSNEGIWRFELTEPLPTDLPAEEQIELLYRNSRIIECNDVKARQYGFSRSQELIGKTLDEFLVRPDKMNDNYLRIFIKSGYRLIDKEIKAKDKNGDDRHFSSSLIGVVEDGFLIRIWGVQRDITELTRVRQTYLESEEQLRRSQKVEAIGRLAGGIAHDFNNFLAVIMLHVDMLSLQLPPDSSLRFRVEEIKSVTNNTAAMVRQLLAFGRKQTLQPHPTILNHIARDFIKIIRPLIGEDIEIVLNLNSDLGVCFVDPDQLTQVLMNLAVNARDAMPYGGVLKIETSNISLNKNLLRLKTQPVGDYIQLTVTDNGAGMDVETQKRIFEPFFTTKEANKGTGLGLATVYGIVKQSNGFIWVESEIGNGTAFKLQFPRIDQPAKFSIKEKIGNMPLGDETILLVEDKKSVRRATLEVLNFLGYQILEAENGVLALELAENFSKPIHLLLTDVIMPQMNGRDLAEQIGNSHPETAILFMSGYNDDIISDHGILEENVQLLNKPFTPLMLAAKVREVLDNKSPKVLPRPIKAV